MIEINVIMRVKAKDGTTIKENNYTYSSDHLVNQAIRLNLKYEALLSALILSQEKQLCEQSEYKLKSNPNYVPVEPEEPSEIKIIWK